MGRDRQIRWWGAAAAALLLMTTAIMVSRGGVASASGPYSWTSCKNTGSGIYTNSSCSVKGAGGFEWTKVKEGMPTTFTATGTSSFVLKIRMYFESATINCSSQSSEGTLENPTGGGTATVSNMSFKLSGCTVSEPANCTVPEGTLTFHRMNGTTSETKEGRTVQFESGSFLFELGGASCSLHGLYKDPVTLGAIDNPTTSSFEFTKSSSTFAPFVGGEGIPPTLEGTTKIQTTAGEALKLTP